MSKKTNKNSRIISTAFILLLLTMITACEPVSYPTLPEEQMGTSSESAAKTDTTAGSLTVEFEPVLGAVSYGYSITESNGAAKAASSINWAASYSYDKATGKIIMTINSNDFSMDISYNITVFGRDKNNKETEVTTVNDYKVPLLDLNSNAPDVFLSRVTEDSAEISIRKEIYPGHMEYKAVYQDADGNTQEKLFTSFPITISNFESGNIAIYQKYQSDADFSTTTKILTVDSSTMKAALDLSIEGSVFNVTNLPEDTAFIEIWNVTDTSQIKITEGRPGDTLSTDLFAYGFFMAAAYKEDGSFAAYSNSVNTVLPISIQDTLPRQQSIVLTFKIAEGTDISAATVKTDISGATADISQAGNTASILVKGLTSRAKYTGNVSVVVSGETFTIPLDFETTSFAGTYEWKPNNPKTGNKYAKIFTVFVKDSPDYSDHKYYIYADEIIDKVPAGSYRIMPLIDYKVDSNIPEKDTYFSYPTSTEAFENSPYYTKAYVWNNKKWNSSTMNPTQWKIKTDNSDKSSDIFLSEIISDTVFGSATTQTSFIFTEEDGVLNLTFFNKITDGLKYIVSLGNSALRKNPDADPNDEKAPYTFTLSYTGAAE